MDKKITPLTKEQCRQLSDELLLDMVARAQGHTKEFLSFMNTDFSYSFLTDLLKDRGYENGWYKKKEEVETKTMQFTPKVVSIKKPENPTVRKNITIDAQVAEEWIAFNKAIPYNSVTTSLAFSFFMKNVRAGRIVFKYDFGFGKEK